MLRLFLVCFASILLCFVACGGDTPSQNICKTNTDCPNGQYCTPQGNCTADCKTTSDCLAGKKCTSFGKCIPAQPDSGPPKDSTPQKIDTKLAPDTKPATDLPNPDFPWPDLPEPDLPKPDLPKPDLPKPDLPAPDLPKPDLAKPDLPKPDLPRPDLPKPDSKLPKPDLLQPDLTPKPDLPIPDLPIPDLKPKPDLPKPDLPVKNLCGGLATLSPKPKSPCGNCGFLVCDGINATKCSQGPEMVNIGKYCIDAYEGSAWSKPECAGVQYGVGKKDYPAGFSHLVESKGITGGYYKPQTTPVYACSKSGIRPSGDITYYQAKRACENVGKRICKDSELVNACRGSNYFYYPYGNTYKSGLCNDNQTFQKKTVSTGQYSKCAGAYSGIYDLSGNVYETAMHPTAGPKACSWRGGSYAHPYIYSGCYGATFGCTPHITGPHIGFRCCRDSLGAKSPDGAMPADQKMPVKDAAVPDTGTSPCGSITSYGTCTGTKLKYCDTTSSPNKLIQYDCAQYGSFCGIIDKSIGVGCILPNPCGNETVQGRCDGNTVVYCDVANGPGKVKKVPCGKYKCDPKGGPSGSATCVSKCIPNTTWCVGTKYVATCMPSSTISYTDCSSSNALCQTGSTGSKCVKFSFGNRIIHGTISYPYRSPGGNGYGAVKWYLAKNVNVGILSPGSTHFSVVAYADNNGSYKIAVPNSVPKTFQIYIMPRRVDADGSLVQVLNTKKQLYGPYVTHTMAKSIEQLDIKVLEPSGIAISIFDDVTSSIGHAKAVSGATNRSLNVYWEKGVKVPCGGCFTRYDSVDPTKILYVSDTQKSSIYLSGDSVYQNHYDTSVIAHEVGHYAIYLFSKSDSPGGSHSIASKLVPPFAWNEGMATAYGQTWQNSPYYTDGDSTGWYWIDLSSCWLFNGYSYGSLKWPSLGEGILQPLDEMVVGSMIWSVAKKNKKIVGSMNLGFKNVWTVATKYMPKNDRGYKGVELLDFIDGLVCKKFVTTSQVSTMFVGSYKYPYDFNGPNTCP